MLPWIPIEILHHPGDLANLCRCYSLTPVVFLSSCHLWFLTSLSFYCLVASDHCLSSGCLVGFVLFIFLNSTPTINCWLTLCVMYSAFAREDVGPFIQSWPPLLGRALTPGSSLLQPGLWVSDPFWAYFKTSCGSNRLCENIKNNNTVLTVDQTLFQMIYC